MFLFDRIYGQIKFPSIIKDVLDCPGLLRLREVRMANIPFLSFPSFSAVTRYEHSIGVCHLAELFANRVGLSEKDKIEVMLAALYHDAATPPFAHAMEEVLNELFGFNHEEKLREIIIGKSKNLGGQLTQVYLGHSLKLHKICQRKECRKLGLDIYRIADLAAGTDKDPLGDLVCSKDIDLDNIDNVIRSASAMGIQEFNPNIAEVLAQSFTFDGTKIKINEVFFQYIKKWQKLRATLYGMIFASLRDFALQSMLKDAVRRLCQNSSEYKLYETDWSFTDDQRIYERLLKFPPSAAIVNRMRLGKIYTCLAFLLVERASLLTQQSSYLGKIENIAKEIYENYINATLKPKKKKFNSPEIVVNFYKDKRKRPITKLPIFSSNKNSKAPAPQKLIIGVFTPSHRKWNKNAFNIFLNKLKSEANVMPVKILFGKYPDIIGAEES